MKYNFWKGFGFLISMSFLLVSGYSNVKAQTGQTTCGQKKADKFLVEGQAAYDKKDYVRAVTLYDQVIKATPNCPVPFFQKALISMDAKKYDDAVWFLQEASKRNFNGGFRVYYEICEARMQQQNFEEAIKSCEESARLNDNFYGTFYNLAVSQISLNNVDKALTAIRRASELDPKSIDALLLKARILNSLKKFDEAVTDLTAALKLNPKSDEAYFLLGANYFLLKDYPKAVENLAQSVKFNPDNFDAWMLLSSAYIGDSLNWEKSEVASFQAVRIKPDDGNANFQLALAQLVSGKLELSLKSFDAAIKNKTILTASAMVYKGYVLIGLKRTAEAEKLFQQALTVKPTNKVDYFALAEIYYYRWELDKAREQIRKGIDFANDDEDWQEYSTLSYSYSLSNDPQQAIIAANEAIQLNPKNDLGYTNRCRAYNETNLPDIAIKDCQKALEIKPNDGEVFFYLGRAYALKKDAAQETAYNQKAIAMMEKRLGFSANPQNGGQPVNSKSSADNGKVSINSPTYTYYLYLLGNAYFLNKNYEAAIVAYQKVTELRPNFPRLRYNLAASYLSLKKPDLKNADAQYTALLPIDPKLAADLKKIINGYRRKK